MLSTQMRDAPPSSAFACACMCEFVCVCARACLCFLCRRASFLFARVLWVWRCDHICVCVCFAPLFLSVFDPVFACVLECGMCMIICLCFVYVYLNNKWWPNKGYIWSQVYIQRHLLPGSCGSFGLHLPANLLCCCLSFECSCFRACVRLLGVSRVRAFACTQETCGDGRMGGRVRANMPPTFAPSRGRRKNNRHRRNPWMRSRTSQRRLSHDKRCRAMASFFLSFFGFSSPTHKSWPSGTAITRTSLYS